MKLKNILNLLNINVKIDIKFLNMTVTSIETVSKKVRPGSIFIAIKGNKIDGHSFIDEAFQKGAIIAFVEKDPINIQDYNNEISRQRIILVKSTKAILYDLCSIFYNKLPKNIVAITGTNGKTSTSCIISQLLKYQNINCAQLGTLGGFFNGQKVKLLTSLTTPPAEETFKFFNEARLQNIDTSIIEASSHGIDQGRLNNIPIKIAAFTNLSQDHLDYHKNMESYFYIKSRLFLNLLRRDGLAIINHDDPYGVRLIKMCKENSINVLTYGKNSDDLKLIDIYLKDFNYFITFLYKQQVYKVNLNILGAFQIYNLLCAILIILSLDLANIDDIVENIPKIKSINGRLEYIRKYNQANIFLDYAHTPEALELALQTLSSITLNKLYVVFGCGGDRDISKRKIMGKIASNLADFSYITDDNPRNENPQDIRLEISNGFADHEKYTIIPDRKLAILKAIKNLRPGDILLVAGKGHEETQIIGNRTIFHSDKEIILSVKED